MLSTWRWGGGLLLEIGCDQGGCNKRAQTEGRCRYSTGKDGMAG